MLCGRCRQSSFRAQRSEAWKSAAFSRPARPHCEKRGESGDAGASARSGCAKQRSLLCPLSERRRRHPRLFAVLDFLVLLGQAKSTKKNSCRLWSASFLALSFEERAKEDREAKMVGKPPYTSLNDHKRLRCFARSFRALGVRQLLRPTFSHRGGGRQVADLHDRTVKSAEEVVSAARPRPRAGLAR